MESLQVQASYETQQLLQCAVLCCAALTVQAQYGWREGWRVWECELDGVLSGPLEQLWSLLALLLLQTFLLALLLLPGHDFLSLLLLHHNTYSEDI